MPTYNFRHKKSGRIIEKTMTIAEAEKYSKAHPKLDWLCGLPMIGDPWRMGRLKPPGAFKDKLKQIKQHNRGSKINTWD